ncbi:hypothetical protein BDF22DRAFT_22434 [Syncephalis plumigaleata]|nr:hypothetical protein BDF22DRAFT_22434 [Syncephalis plumigaleata]
MPPSPTPSLEESTLDDSTEVESDDEIHSTPTPGTSSTDLSCINHHSADAEHQQQYITPAKNGQLDLTMMVNPGRASCDPTKANHDDTLVEYMPRVIPSALQAVEELAKLQKKDRYQRERSQTPTIDLPQQMPTESAEQRSITVTTNDATATTNNNNGSAFDRILPARWSDTLSRVLRADIISAIGLAQ